MIRAQRRRHALTWALLAPAIIALLAVALLNRAPRLDRPAAAPAEAAP